MERAEQVRDESELNLLHLVDSEEGHIEELVKMERQRWIVESEDEGEMRLQDVKSNPRNEIKFRVKIGRPRSVSRSPAHAEGHMQTSWLR